MKGLLKNEKRFKLIVFLTSVLVLGTMFKCAGQTTRVNRFKNEPGSISIYKSDKIVLADNRYDTDDELTYTIIGVVVDSVNVDDFKTRIFVYYPEKIVGLITEPSLDLIVKDGRLSFKPCYIEKNLNYAEFIIPLQEKIILSNENVSGFVINTGRVRNEYITNAYSDYFRDFILKNPSR